VIGADTNRIGHAVFANYLHACGRTDLFNLIPETVLNPRKIDEVLVFA
jgi:hypothetical protein